MWFINHFNYIIPADQLNLNIFVLKVIGSAFILILSVHWFIYRNLQIQKFFQYLTCLFFLGAGAYALLQADFISRQWSPKEISAQEKNFVHFFKSSIKEPIACTVNSGADFRYIRYALYPQVRFVWREPYECVVVYKKIDPETFLPGSYKIYRRFDETSLIALRRGRRL